MTRKIKLFFDLPGDEKLLFIEAYFLLGVMRALVLTVSFKRLTRSLEQIPDDNRQICLTEKQQHTAKTIGRIISIAANNTQWKSACLAQTLTAQKMLKKRNIPGIFYLGVRKDSTAEEKLKAHAWTQCGELIITGEKGHELYSVIAVYGWGEQ